MGGGSEKSVRRRGLIARSLSSVEPIAGVLEVLSMAIESSYSSGGGENDQTWTMISHGN